MKMINKNKMEAIYKKKANQRLKKICLFLSWFKRLIKVVFVLNSTF